MNLSPFRTYIELGFKDIVSGTHYGKKVEADGTTSTEISDEFSYRDLPCKISFPKPEQPSDSNSEHVPIAVNVQLFCKYDADIQPGDYVVASVLDNNKNILATYKGTAGLAKTYDTHKELLFRIEESA